MTSKQKPNQFKVEANYTQPFLVKSDYGREFIPRAIYNDPVAELVLRQEGLAGKRTSSQNLRPLRKKDEYALYGSKNKLNAWSSSSKTNLAKSTESLASYEEEEDSEPTGVNEERNVILTDWGIDIFNPNAANRAKPLMFQPKLKSPADHPLYFPSKHKELPPQFDAPRRFGSRRNILAVTPGKIRRSADRASYQMLQNQRDSCHLHVLRYMKVFQKFEPTPVETLVEPATKKKKAVQSLETHPEDDIDSINSTEKNETFVLVNDKTSTKESPTTSMDIAKPLTSPGFNANDYSPDHLWLKDEKKKLYEDWGRNHTSNGSPAIENTHDEVRHNDARHLIESSPLVEDANDYQELKRNQEVEIDKSVVEEEIIIPSSTIKTSAQPFIQANSFTKMKSSPREKEAPVLLKKKNKTEDSIPPIPVKPSEQAETPAQADVQPDNHASSSSAFEHVQSEPVMQTLLPSQDHVESQESLIKTTELVKTADIRQSVSVEPIETQTSNWQEDVVDRDTPLSWRQTPQSMVGDDTPQSTEIPKSKKKGIHKFSKKMGGFLNAMDAQAVESDKESIYSDRASVVSSKESVKFKDKLKGSFGNIASAFKKDKDRNLKSALSSDALASDSEAPSRSRFGSLSMLNDDTRQKSRRSLSSKSFGSLGRMIDNRAARKSSVRSMNDLLQEDDHVERASVLADKPRQVSSEIEQESAQIESVNAEKVHSEKENTQEEPVVLAIEPKRLQISTASAVSSPVKSPAIPHESDKDHGTVLLKKATIIQKKTLSMTPISPSPDKTLSMSRSLDALSPSVSKKLTLENQPLAPSSSGMLSPLVHEVSFAFSKSLNEIRESPKLVISSEHIPPSIKKAQSQDSTASAVEEVKPAADKPLNNPSTHSSISDVGKSKDSVVSNLNVSPIKSKLDMIFKSSSSIATEPKELVSTISTAKEAENKEVGTPSLGQAMYEKEINKSSLDAVYDDEGNPIIPNKSDHAVKKALLRELKNNTTFRKRETICVVPEDVPSTNSENIPSVPVILPAQASHQPKESVTPAQEPKPSSFSRPVPPRMKANAGKPASDNAVKETTAVNEQSLQVTSKSAPDSGEPTSLSRTNSSKRNSMRIPPPPTGPPPPSARRSITTPDVAAPIYNPTVKSIQTPENAKFEKPETPKYAPTALDSSKSLSEARSRQATPDKSNASNGKDSQSIINPVPVELPKPSVEPNIKQKTDIESNPAPKTTTVSTTSLPKQLSSKATFKGAKCDIRVQDLILHCTDAKGKNLKHFFPMELNLVILAAPKGDEVCIHACVQNKNAKDGGKLKKLTFQVESNIQSKLWADVLMAGAYEGYFERIKAKSVVILIDKFEGQNIQKLLDKHMKPVFEVIGKPIEFKAVQFSDISVGNALSSIDLTKYSHIVCTSNDYTSKLFQLIVRQQMCADPQNLPLTQDPIDASLSMIKASIGSPKTLFISQLIPVKKEESKLKSLFKKK